MSFGSRNLRLLGALGATLVSSLLPAAEPAAEPAAPVARLQAGDIEHFIESYPKMAKELQALDKSFGNIENPSALRGMMANEQVQAVLSRHGWDQADYVAKLTAIAGGFAALKMEEELANVPAEQRAMIQSMMAAKMPQFMVVHPNDLALVKRSQEALQRFFDSQ